MTDQLSLDAVQSTIEMYETLIERGETLEPEDYKFLAALKAFLEQKKRRLTLRTIPDASKETGVPARTIYYAIERGEIPHTPIPGTKYKLVAVEDVVYWKDHPEIHKKPGRQVRKKSD